MSQPGDTPALETWLRRATRGLPRAAAASARDELRDHFADAVADYEAAGLSLAAAQHAALADLGDEAATQQGFQAAHGANRRYLLAALLGMAYPALYLLSIPWNTQVAGTMVFNLVIFLPLLYLVYSFKTVLALRPHGADFRLYERIIHTGIVAMCVPRLLGWLLYHQPTIAEAYFRVLGDAHSLGELALNIVAVFGLLLAALGFVLMGERALRLRERLYGLLKPSGLLAMLCGGGLALYCLGVFMGSSDLRASAEALAVMSGMVAVVLWAIIFFRARSELTQWA